MTRRTLGLAALLLVLPVARSRTEAAENRVDVVVGPRAPELERFASRELTRQLRKLFGVEVRGLQRIAPDSDHVILLGSPATNPAVQEALGERWPKLSDQGHLLRSVTHGGRKVLVVGGGSPVATLWAAYELGYRFGVRYLLHGDIYPAGPVALKLDGFDVKLEPSLRVRTWSLLGDSPTSSMAQGLAEHRRVLSQLAKLKFNRVLISVEPWQPFVHFDFSGIKKQTGVIWRGERYPIDGDMAGRRVFGEDEKEFNNPDFIGKSTYEQRVSAGTALVRGIIDTAHELGISAALAVAPLHFPKEFADVLPRSAATSQHSVAPAPKQDPENPQLKGLLGAQLAAYLKMYPDIDACYLSLSPPLAPRTLKDVQRAWGRLRNRPRAGDLPDLEKLEAAVGSREKRGADLFAIGLLGINIVTLDCLLTELDHLKRRPGGEKVAIVFHGVVPGLWPYMNRLTPEGTEYLHLIDPPDQQTAGAFLAPGGPGGTARLQDHHLVLPLALIESEIGLLPQSTTRRLHEFVRLLRKHKCRGFVVSYRLIGELDPVVHYLGRAGFDADLTPETAYADLVTAVCGEGVADRFIKGLDLIARATDLIDDAKSRGPISMKGEVDGVRDELHTQGPLPAWWKKARDLYAAAMDEMYRGVTRSRKEGDPFIRYYAKRLEFALHYLSCVEAVRLAGNARAKGDKARQLEQLEKAVEDMYNALDAYSEVARDSGDRGVIAVLNEYGYRPLRAELARVEKAAKAER